MAKKKFSLYCTWAGLSRCIRIGKLYAYFEGPYRPAIPPRSNSSFNIHFIHLHTSSNLIVNYFFDEMNLKIRQERYNRYIHV